jgi:hypothetical protein
MKKIKQRKGTVVLIALAAIFLFLGGGLLWLGKTHVGPGWTLFGGFGDESSGDTGADLRRGRISESEYKRQSYFEGGILFLFGVATLCGAIGVWKKRNELERSWERTISNPQNVQEILQHSELYRNDFRRWIKENHPNLLATETLGQLDDQESEKLFEWIRENDWEVYCALLDRFGFDSSLSLGEVIK